MTHSHDFAYWPPQAALASTSFALPSAPPLESEQPLAFPKIRIDLLAAIQEHDRIAWRGTLARMPLLSIPEGLRNPVTGLPNEEASQQLVHDAVDRMPGAFCEIDADVESLDWHNSAYGHNDGNKYLQTIGAVLTAELHAYGLPYVVTNPYGDSFRMLVAGAGTQTAADKIMEWLEAGLNDYGLELTLAGRPHRASETSEALMKDVDQMLFARKREGKHAYYSPTQHAIGRLAIEMVNAAGIRIRDLKYLASLYEAEEREQP